MLKVLVHVIDAERRFVFHRYGNLRIHCQQIDFGNHLAVVVIGGEVRRHLMHRQTTLAQRTHDCRADHLLDEFTQPIDLPTQQRFQRLNLAVGLLKLAVGFTKKCPNVFCRCGHGGCFA
ncbi:hypothetical protein [Halochromatium sp.]